MADLFVNPVDQMKESERIFFEARDQWSVEKHPSYLRVQIDCLKAIRTLKYNLDQGYDPRFPGTLPA